MGLENSVAGLTVGALVIYGLVGVVKDNVPQVVGKYAFVLNVVLGIIFGYLGLFGLNGLEAGILASLSSTGGNALLNKLKQ